MRHLHRWRQKRDVNFLDSFSSTKYQVISISVVIISLKLCRDYTCKVISLISHIKSTIWALVNSKILSTSRITLVKSLSTNSMAAIFHKINTCQVAVVCSWDLMHSLSTTSLKSAKSITWIKLMTKWMNRETWQNIMPSDSDLARPSRWIKVCQQSSLDMSSHQSEFNITWPCNHSQTILLISAQF